MIEYFAEYDPTTGVVSQCIAIEFPYNGTFRESGMGYKSLDAAIDWSSQPSPTSVLKLKEGSLVWVEEADMAVLRERKNSEINACREAANTDVFMFQGKAIRCRPLDRSDIDGTNGYVALFGEFPQGWAGGWKAADNSYVQIATVDDWKAFYKAMVDTGNANFRYAQQLKARLAVAETHEQVAAIKWETANA